MQRKPTEAKRRMVPRWRSFLHTPSIELVSSVVSRPPPLHGGGIEAAVHAWEAEKSIWTASEMVSASLIFGKSSESDAAANFLRANFDTSIGLHELARNYFGELPSIYGPVSPARSTHTERIQHTAALSRLRRLINLNPRNSILYLEAARHYVSLGQLNKAKEVMRRALILSPSNRFVVRSAARLFVHEEDFDRAWSVVKNTSPTDPWLVACRLTVEELAGKPISGMRSAKSLVAGQRSPGQITELAAAMGTLEAAAGGIKTARKLFRQSAELPTENTVAQLRWASESIGTPFDEALLHIERSFEARAGFAVHNKNWHEAVENCREWLLDETFSSRAATLGCYISAEILDEHEQAIWFANYGLLFSPSDLSFLNNRAYSLAKLGRLEEARADLATAFSRVNNTKDRIFLTATQGALYYAESRADDGTEEYRKSIRLALDDNNKEAAYRAFMHWTHEEYQLGRRLSEEMKSQISKLFSPEKLSGSILDIYLIYLGPAMADEANPGDRDAIELPEEVFAILLS